MRIVHVEEFFYPQAGYQINLLARYMAKGGNRVFIISSEVDKLPNHLSSFFVRDLIESQDQEYQTRYGVKIFRKPVYGYFNRKNLYRLGYLKYLKTIDFIKKLEPDILFVHGNDNIFGILSIIYSKNWKFPLILDNHMLDMATHGDPLRHLFRFIYRVFITPIIKKRHLIIIRTQNDNYVERYLGIPLSQAPWISYGSDIQLFKPDHITRKQFRKENKIIDSDFVIIYAGKLIESKGVELLMDAIEYDFINSKNKKIIIMIVGNFPDGEYGEKIKQKINKAKNKIIYFPTQNYSELAKFYQASDLAVFPKQCSLSFYDMQACGLPVVSEDNNINIDRLQCNNGFTFRSGDFEDFRNKIIQCVEMDNKTYNNMRASARKFIVNNFNYEDITKQYIDVISNSINKYNEMSEH